jgi:CRP-like cAMP-binding protein
MEKRNMENKDENNGENKKVSPVTSLQGEIIKNILLATRLSHYLNTHEMDMLLSHCESLSFAQGHIILKQGKVSQGFYIVIEGQVIGCARILGEGSACLNKVNVGDFFGETSMIDSQPSITTFIAESDVQCVFIKDTYFRMLTLFFPEVKYQLMQAICESVYKRFLISSNGIFNLIKHALNVKRSFIGELINYLHKPKIITLEKSGLTLQQIKKNYLFDLFTESEVNELLKHVDYLDAPKQCVLIHENESNQPCYIVLRGAVQSCLIFEDKIAKISVQGPFQIISHLSLIDMVAPAGINCTTCEHAILLRISHDKMTYLQQNHVELWYKLFDLIGKSLVELERETNELYVRLKTEF